MEFSFYQQEARNTAQLDTSTFNGKVELLLGLQSEAGSLSRIYKKLVRDGITLTSQTEQIGEEIGDVLWYLTMIAASMDLDLDELATANLARTSDRYDRISDAGAPYQPDFDSGYPDQQRFPRRMIFSLKGVEKDGLPHARFALEEADPNAFPHGQVKDGKKKYGYTLGAEIGDVVNDNAAEDDGYRYHDAVHIAFMAVLGWSPVMRALLRIKRKDSSDVDRIEDGARAGDLEEALSALLMAASEDRNRFQKTSDVDGEVRDLIRRVIGKLEVRSVPIRLWADAIHQGYEVMGKLKANNGGYVLADLDAGKIAFYAERPTLLKRASVEFHPETAADSGTHVDLDREKSPRRSLPSLLRSLWKRKG
ncbi:MAG: hypothetical protein EBR82_20070 [Caulobacteraceae bacterium]|nr:hypothetical protein [Caulobacteraceae bacterium]